MKCDYCGEHFKPKHPTQRFCPPIRGRRVCKDNYHNQRCKPVIVNGVAAPKGFMGLSDDEHEAAMDMATINEF